MAEETARKTRLGLLKGLQKLEEVEGTLEEVTPAQSVLYPLLDRCKALTAALLIATRNLFEAACDLAEGDEPSAQLTIDGLTAKVSRVTGAKGGDLDAVREAAGGEVEDPADASAANVAAFFGAGADVEGCLAALDESLPSRAFSRFTVERWSAEERAAVSAWLAAKAGGSTLPLPPVLERRYLEDLEPAKYPLDLKALLSWLGLTVDGTALDMMSLAEQQEIAAWAAALWRHRRGEAVEVPAPPAAILPTHQTLLDLDNAVAKGELADWGAFVAMAQDRAPAYELAVEALAGIGAIVTGEDGPQVPEVRPVVTVEAVREALAERWGPIAVVTLHVEHVSSEAVPDAEPPEQSGEAA